MNQIEYTIGEGKITLSGRAMPEDPADFYHTLIKRLELIVEGERDLEFDFKLKYFNSVSTIYVTRMMSLLEELASTADVLVTWYYDDDDEDIKELGEYHKKIREMPFQLIAVPAPKLR